MQLLTPASQAVYWLLPNASCTFAYEMPCAAAGGRPDSREAYRIQARTTALTHRPSECFSFIELMSFSTVVGFSRPCAAKSFLYTKRVSGPHQLSSHRTWDLAPHQPSHWLPSCQGLSCIGIQHGLLSSTSDCVLNDTCLEQHRYVGTSQHARRLAHN